MAGNMDILKKGYEDFGNGDIEAATEPWPDDFVWDGGSSSDLPGGGEHKGKDKALQTLQQAVGAWDKFELHIDELVGDGDTVVALGHTHLEKGGESAQLPVVHVWRFADGTPKRIQILTDTHQSAKLLGVG